MHSLATLVISLARVRVEAAAAMRAELAGEAPVGSRRVDIALAMQARIERAIGELLGEVA